MKTKFDFYDYFIFFLILFISIGIGIYFGFKLDVKLKIAWNDFFKSKYKRAATFEMKANDSDLVDREDEELKNKTMHYLTANKSMGALPIALSLFATYFSSITFLGLPAEIYQYGIEHLLVIFGIGFIPFIGGNYFILTMYMYTLKIT